MIWNWNWQFKKSMNNLRKEDKGNERTIYTANGQDWEHFYS